MEGSGILDDYLKISSYLYKPSKSYNKLKNFIRDPQLPPNKTLYEMENESYQEKAKNNIDDFVLVEETPTLKFYKNGNIIVVSIRGTADSKDLMADISSIAGNVANSSRYKQDEKVLMEFKQKYPKSKYFGVAHSLGGMILDEFIKKGLIIQGVSYNPAVQKSEMGNSQNYRIYSDPIEAIQQLMGKWASNTEVRKSPLTKGIIHNIAKYTTGDPVTPLRLHLLSNFKGGSYIRRYNYY
jgi:hypothetical protein